VVRSVARIALAITLIAAMPAVQSAADPNGSQTTAPAKKPLVKAAKKTKHAKTPVVTTEPAPSPPVAAAPPPPPAVEAPKPPDPKQAIHFASLRAEKVNLRSGPSADFPIQWVYVRRGLPVEVVASFDIWRKIRDIDGTEGWVNQQMLTGHRSVLVSGAVRDLRHDPKSDAEIVAKLEVGVVAAISKCDPTWCEVKAGGYKGWLMREEVWGLEPGEVIE
jgi:SH3-like domain-containing protein